MKFDVNLSEHKIRFIDPPNTVFNTHHQRTDEYSSEALPDLL